MGIFDDFFGTNNQNPEDKYIKKYGENNTDIINKEISKAINLKREGDFKGANSIYVELNNKYGSNPVILKSWAKILVCLSEYDEAIAKYEEASKLYSELGSGEYWQCDRQSAHIRSRHDDPQRFKEWVSAISGGALKPEDVEL